MRIASMTGLVIMDIETQCEAIHCSILANLSNEETKAKHGLVPCRGTSINTGKQNKELISLRHTQATRIEPIQNLPKPLAKSHRP